MKVSIKVVIRKVTTIAVLAFVATASFADDSVAARGLIAESMRNLASAPATTIMMDGYIDQGRVRTPFHVSFATEIKNVDGTPTAYVELVMTKNNVMTHRMAGDGRNLWSYDFRTNSYSSLAYQTDGSVPRTDFLSRLLTQASKWAPKEADFAIRSIRDVYLGQSLEQRWSPFNAAPSMQIMGSAIQCPAPRLGSNMTYAFTSDDNGYLLDTVSYVKSLVVSGNNETTAWSATFYKGAVPPDTDYRFVPPKNSIPKVVGG